MARKKATEPPPESWKEYDDDDDRRVPPVRVWVASDKLAPSPPPNWIQVFRYRLPPPSYANEMSMWICLLQFAQECALKAGRRLHMIARIPTGCRVLLVHPSLRAEIEEIVDVFDCHEQTCGCFAHYAFSDDGFHALVNRKWRGMSIPQRLERLACNGLPPHFARHGRFSTIPAEERERLFEDPDFLTE
jgi:hypothetical protein